MIFIKSGMPLAMTSYIHFKVKVKR